MMSFKWSEVFVTQSYLTLCDPMDCSPPGSSVHGILQPRILEWVTISFSKGSSQPRHRTLVSYIAGRLFTAWAKSLISERSCLYLTHLYKTVNATLENFTIPQSLLFHFHLFIFNFLDLLAVLSGPWDFNSWARDWTCTPCSGSVES